MARRKKTIKKYEKKLLILLIILSICVFGLMIALIVFGNDSQSNVAENDHISRLLKGDPGVPGRSCGILSELEAKNLLPTYNLKGTFSNGPTNNRVTLEDSEAATHWSDSCRYLDSNNSNIYVQLFIDTYLDEEQASADLNSGLPVGGMVEKVDSNKYDELFYSSGAWFAREGKVLLRVSANDGRSGDLKDFSKNVFTILTLQL